MSCFAIDKKARALRAGAVVYDALDLRGACRRKHIAALRRERRILALLEQSEPMTLAELVTASGESLSSVYSTILRLRARGAIVSSQRGHSRAHAHTLRKAA